MAHIPVRAQFDAAVLQWRSLPEGPRKRFLGNRLVQSQEGLVNKFVHRLLKFSQVQMDVEDAMQAGRLGLFVALTKYDPKRPTSFSTCAWWWIKCEVKHALERGSTIYRPKGTGMPYKTMIASDVFERRNGRKPEPDELGVTEKELHKWQSVVFSFLPLNDLRESGGEEDDHVTGESQPRSNDIPADEQLAEKQFNRALTRAVNKLSAEELSSIYAESPSITTITKIRKAMEKAGWTMRP